MTRTITLTDEDAAGLLALAKEKSGIFQRGPWSRIAAALEAPAVDGWQPIETAPKDGTSILVYGLPSRHPHLQSWFEAPTRIVAQWDQIDEAFCIAGGDWCGPFVPATHWMPLPAPPVSP
jgi:hypothetical protein